MNRESNLEELLANMEPLREPGEFVFVTLRDLSALASLATVVEREGVTHVFRREDADAFGFPYTFVAAWITLRVRSALDAVGLTAAVSTALADAGISCNMLAGFHHDHLLVPAVLANDALETLERLSVAARSSGTVQGRVEPSVGDAKIHRAEIVEAEIVDAEIVDAEIADAEIVDT